MKAWDLKPLKSSVCCDAVDEPVGYVDARGEVVVGAQTHVIEGQIVEEEAARVVDLILGVVAFDAECAGPLAEVELKTGADGGEITAVGLKEIAPDLGAKLVGAGALEGLGGLAELEVDAAAEALVGSGDGEVLDDDVGLVDAEAVAR